MFQLKKALDDHHQVTASLPDHTWSIPESILQKRSVVRGGRSILQLLIKWSGVPESLATWEDAEALRQQFSGAAVFGGQPARQEGGC